MDYMGSFDSGFNLAALMSVLMMSAVITVFIYVFVCVLYMRLFQKAGREGWKAFIPIYNIWVLYEVCYMPGWLVLLSFVPIVNFVTFVANIIAMYRLPQCYEKGKLWGVLNIFFAPIVLIICAFDRSEYCGYENNGGN